MRDTVFALATAPGRAAVAVVRVSGPRASDAAGALGASLPKPRVASLRRLSSGGEPIDEALLLWFPAPRSFTGEHCLELQLHGGAAVVEAVSEALLVAGLRLAEPGEFTRRAFENGRLELSQAEAVADLVDAETGTQRRQALAQLGGALAERYGRWREALVEALAWLEAEVDFPDEELPEHLASRAGEPLLRLRGELAAALDDLRGERVRQGLRIALVGAPNAGKSSLINALLGRDAVIVTDVPGTTRDVIEAPLDIDGYRVVVADMAGVRETADLIEAEGVRRASVWAGAADLRLWLVDRAADGLPDGAADLVREGDLLVLTKSDRAIGDAERVAREEAHERGLDMVSISVRDETGLAPLQVWLSGAVRRLMAGGDFPAATRLRHRELLRDSLSHLDRALATLGHAGPELAAEDVRLAARALERLSGRVDAEAVLDRIFATFCIGK